MSKRFLTPIESDVPNGTAPLIVDSSTVVSNFNADLLDGQHGTYYAPIASPTFTGTVSIPQLNVTTSASISAGTSDFSLVLTNPFSDASANLWRIGPTGSSWTAGDNKFVFTYETAVSASALVTFDGPNKRVGINTASPSSTLHIAASSSATVATIIRGAASQSANLTEWQNSSGTVLTSIGSDGQLLVKTNSTAQFSVQTGGGSKLFEVNSSSSNAIATIDASTFGDRTIFRIKAHPSQILNMTEWQNSSGTVLASMSASGNFSAVTKSFDISHPTKENMRLRYGSLEGPENGVYVRGKSNSRVIVLPDYWTGLVEEDSITVHITPVGNHKNLYVKDISNNQVLVGGGIGKIEFFYFIQAERKDTDKLVVEYGN